MSVFSTTSKNSLPSAPTVWMPTAMIAGDRPDRKDRQEEAGNDDLGKGAQDFHEAAHDEAQPAAGGVSCAAARKQSGKAKMKPIRVETSAMLMRFQHQVEIFGDVEAAARHRRGRSG